MSTSVVRLVPLDATLIRWMSEVVRPLLRFTDVFIGGESTVSWHAVFGWFTSTEATSCMPSLEETGLSSQEGVQVFAGMSEVFASPSFGSATDELH